MEVRRAIPSDAPVIAAFVREEFLRRPDLRADSSLWTDEFALKQVARQYCVFTTEHAAVVGVFMVVGGELALGSEAHRADTLSIGLAAGSDRRQVRTLDLLMRHTYADRWAPEGIPLLVGEAYTDSSSYRWWVKNLRGSTSPGKASPTGQWAWGVASTLAINGEAQARLAHG